MSAPLAPKTRTIVAKLIANLPETRRDPESIAEMVKTMHGKILEEEQQDLNRLALAVILNGVCKRRGRAVIADENQVDFWQQNPLKRILSVTDKAGRKVRKSPYEMTFAEAERYVDDHTSKRDDMSKTVRGLAEVIDTIRKYVGSEDMTLGECWQAKRRDEAA